MRISSISMTMESRVNFGDYQGAMAQITIAADLDGETPEDAFKQLRATAQQQLVYCIKSGSPKTIRNLVGGEAAAEPEPEPEKGNGTRKRRTKAEMAADDAKAKAAAAAAKKKAPAADDLDDELGGNDDLEDGDGLEEGNGVDELDELEDPAPPKELTREDVTVKLRELRSAKGAAAMTKAIQDAGASSYAEVAAKDLPKLYKIACKALAE